MSSVCVIKVVIHHQYRPNNLERLYGAQHDTYGYKVQLLLRAVWRLGRCQGPQNRFSPFSAHISMVLPIACQVYIPFGVHGLSHVLTLG